jgi:single-stranded-DNA-specific exonuclease
MAAESLGVYGGKFALAAGDNIPRGITGIMANYLVNRFKVPALVTAFGEDTVTGSLRSARAYDLRSLLTRCADLFIDWGGHDFAAGFSMVKANWEHFKERLKLITETMELNEEADEETISVDAELRPSYLTPEIFEVADRFEPYGEENEPLIFMARGLKITDINLMGKPEAKHVKLTLDAGKYKWPAIYWNAADKVNRDFDSEGTVDLVFTLSRNWFNGNETPQLMVKDLKRGEA